MPRRLAYSIALFTVALVAPLGLAAAPPDGLPTTVILVRHAEKTSEGLNPPLSAAGADRALALRAALSDVPVAAIYTTPFIRTRTTAGPTAELHGIEPAVLDASLATEDLAARILRDHRGETVMVVGHSNTVPGIIDALGAGPAMTLTDDDYDDLFIVTVDARGTARLLHLHYGAPHHSAP